MKCYNCKAEIPADIKFCTNCGAQVGFDDALVTAAKQGDNMAITKLYNATYNDVYQAIRPFVNDEDTILDIEQDTYLKAFSSLSQLDKASSFRPWIKRIAVNKSKDWLKKKKPILFSDMAKGESDGVVLIKDERVDSQPEVAIDKAETKRLLWEIVDSLSDEQKLAVGMFYFQEMSVKEIAETIECSENTVKSRLNYARKNIEAEVKELEKKGTKLYGLAPIPFLLWLFRANLVQAAHKPNMAMLQAVERQMAYQDAQNIAAEQAYQASSTATQAASGVAKGAGAVAGKSIIVKTMIAVLTTAALVGGALVGAKQISNARKAKEAQEIVQGGVNQEEGDVSLGTEAQLSESTPLPGASKKSETAAQETDIREFYGHYRVNSSDLIIFMDNGLLKAVQGGGVANTTSNYDYEECFHVVKEYVSWEIEDKTLQAKTEDGIDSYELMTSDNIAFNTTIQGTDIAGTYERMYPIHPDYDTSGDESAEYNSREYKLMEQLSGHYATLHSWSPTDDNTIGTIFYINQGRFGFFSGNCVGRHHEQTWAELRNVKEENGKLIGEDNFRPMFENEYEYVKNPDGTVGERRKSRENDQSINGATAWTEWGAVYIYYPYDSTPVPVAEQSAPANPIDKFIGTYQAPAPLDLIIAMDSGKLKITITDDNMAFSVFGELTMEYDTWEVNGDSFTVGVGDTTYGTFKYTLNQDGSITRTELSNIEKTGTSLDGNYQKVASSGSYNHTDSSSRLLTEGDIAGLSKQEINYAKNEIYARHGRKFKTDGLQSYFDSQPWYNGTIEPDDFDESVLNQYEKANVEFLAAAEAKR